nr:DEAD/DEAH box helicase [Clostridium tyrobutyricum]
MGLGKTFVGSEKLNQLDAPYNLLICQKSKIDDWYDHFKSYYDYKVIKYNKAQEISRHSVVIINYDLIWRRPELMKLKDFTLMCDESSMIKNEKSERAKFILKMKAKNIILLSGTPTGGKYEQLWSQCKLLGWKISKKLYWQEFIKSVLLDIGGFKIKKVTGYKNVDRLKRKLHEYGAVFMKTDEVFELPEQIEQKIKIKNTKEYKIFKKDRLITINNTELVGDTSLTKMLYLRQLSSQYNKNKVNQLKDILESTEDRIIIFYNFNKELEIIKKLCEKLDKPISIINGAVKDLDNFNQYNNSITLVQYQAGAMGHNLQKSNKIIYFSLPLQSELFEQSKKRIHRIGQEKTCFYWYLITQNSIEEQIYQTLKERRDYTNKLFEESDF